MNSLPLVWTRISMRPSPRYLLLPLVLASLSVSPELSPSPFDKKFDATRTTEKQSPESGATRCLESQGGEESM